jgi:2'-5' RNA ligase
VRLFVALDLPAAVRDVLASLTPDPELWRPVKREALHVTLAFLGSREASDVDLIKPLIVSSPAPPLALGSILLLPPRRARVLTVELSDPTGALAELQSRLSAGLEAAGVYTPEKRRFRPHVTIARLRPRVQPPRAAALELEPLAFTGEAVTLYVSRLHPSGARYESLASARLA